MRVLFTMLLATGLPFTSCIDRSPDGQVCTTLFAYGVSAHVTNAATGQAIGDATLTLRDGDYTEVMQGLPTGDYVGAGERAGTYSLTAEAAGFETKVINDIVVTEDVCHVKGVRVDIELQPAS